MALGGHAATLADDCILRNEWVCPAYVVSRRDDLAAALGEHVYITVVALALGTLVAFGLALVARRWRRLQGVVLGTSTALYTIPSLALFSLLLPILGSLGAAGLSATTVIIGLVLYSLTILVRGILTGLDAVPADVREAAVGMGYSPRRLLWRVELPLALPTVFASLRVAAVSTVALTTVGVLVQHGGLGNLIDRGQSSNFKPEVLTASVLCVVLAVVADLLILGAERLLVPWRRSVA
ncbi:MAG: ABC transporter permease [Jiangellaceae bacterium]|nr:ABC transporter permease [Jiangellaceae bacterium]